MRIEDLDKPRVVPGAETEILRALDAYHLHWDGPVLRQSPRTEHYRAALQALIGDDCAFACQCSRSEIRVTAKRGPAGYIYPGTCRKADLEASGRAVRVRTSGVRVVFHDRIRGTIKQDLEHEIGDFVVRRVDGIFAYQLAVVIDDADQGVTDVVRGHDILDSTARQIHLQRLLGLNTPSYAHLPLAIDSSGLKLSKMSGAAAISLDHRAPTLVRALSFLGQKPPRALLRAAPWEVIAWAMEHWRESLIPARAGITTHDLA